MTRNTNTRAGIFLAALTITAASGCGLFPFPAFAPTRTTDGGGGNLLTAGFKLVGGQISSLSQDEVQTLSDTVRSALLAVDPNVAVLPEMTNAQASGFIDFLKANNINTTDDITKLTQTAAQNPSSIVIPPSLIQAYTGTSEVTNGNFTDTGNLIKSIFGGM